MTAQPTLRLRDRVRLLLGVPLFVRFTTPDGNCHAACGLSVEVRRGWPPNTSAALSGWPPDHAYRRADAMLEARAEPRPASSELLDAVNGLLGLVQLAESRGDLPANLRLSENHRYVEALALVTRLEGEK